MVDSWRVFSSISSRHCSFSRPSRLVNSQSILLNEPHLFVTRSSSRIDDFPREKCGNIIFQILSGLLFIRFNTSMRLVADMSRPLRIVSSIKSCLEGISFTCQRFMYRMNKETIVKDSPSLVDQEIAVDSSRCRGLSETRSLVVVAPGYWPLERFIIFEIASEEITAVFKQSAVVLLAHRSRWSM